MTEAKLNLNFGSSQREIPKNIPSSGTLIEVQEAAGFTAGVSGLADQVKAFRKRHSLTQDWLAEQVGVTNSTIANLENGRTKTLKLSRLRRLMAVMGEVEGSPQFAALTKDRKHYAYIGPNTPTTVSLEIPRDLADRVSAATTVEGIELEQWILRAMRRQIASELSTGDSVDMRPPLKLPKSRGSTPHDDVPPTPKPKKK